MNINFDQPEVVENSSVDFTSPTVESQATNSRVNFNATPEPVRLSQDSLLQPNLYKDVQSYMVKRFGVDYETADPEKTVADFLEQQRGLEVGNTRKLAPELFFIRGADSETKQIIARAYTLFENLQGAFAEDSDTTAAVTDYFWNIITDPINYVGLGIGGLIGKTSSRAAAVGLRSAARQAAKEAMTGVVGVEARRVAGRSAMTEAIKSGLRSQALKRTGILAGTEGAVAGVNAYGSEKVRTEGGSQEEISLPTIAFSMALGAGLTGLASIFAERVTKVGHGVELASIIKRRPTTAEQQVFAKEAIEELINTLAQTVDWKSATAAGRSILGKNGALPAELLRDLVIGSKEKGLRGVIDFMNSAGFQGSSRRVSYRINDFLKTLPTDAKDALNARIAQVTEGQINSVDQFSDMFAATIEEAGRVLNVQQMAARMEARAQMSRQAMDNVVNQSPINPDELDEVLTAGWDGYFRNVWKRVLVSALPTTAVNILGSATYIAGQTAQDIVLMPRMLFKKGGFQAQKRVILDRFKYLFSPTDNRQVFEAMLRTRPEALEALKDVTNMGVRTPQTVEKLFEAYGAKSKVSQGIIRGTEKAVDTVQALTFVQAQDMFFKTFGLMDSLNRTLLQRSGKSLEEVILSGQFNKLVSEDDLGRAVHDTLKMTFSADYTRRNRLYNDTNKYVSAMAEGLEFLSRAPVTGFVFPFGRFANNIVATTWQFSPVAWMPEVIGQIVKKKGLSGALNANQDVVAKSLVGMGAIATSYQMAKERIEATSDPWWVVRSGADRYDIKNVYPLSAIMLFGDLTYRLANGESIPDDLWRDLGDQIAIGQTANDLNVVDVVEGIFSYMFGSAEDIVAGREVSAASGLTGAAGEILGGLTRPFTTVDDLVGFMTNDLQTYDRRQIDASQASLDSFINGATRYTSRIFDFLQKAGGGEPPDDFEFQRDAVRVGRKEKTDVAGRNVAGVQAMPPRTHAEKMFDMAGMPYWTANFRSRHPEYNRLANEVIAPLLNEYARYVIQNEQFINMNASDRRVFVQQRLRQINKEVDDRISSGINPTHLEWHIEKALLNLRENPKTKDRYDMAIRRLGLTTRDPRKMSMADKFQLNEYLEQIKEFYQ